MHLRALLLAGLSVAHIHCFNTELLNEESLNSLPKALAKFAGRLGTILTEHPNINFGVGVKQWDAKDIDQFNEYFSALKEFVTLAVRYPEALYGVQSPEQIDAQPQSLKEVLDHLLNTDDSFEPSPFTVEPAQPEALLPLMMAKLNFVALRKTYSEFYINHCWTSFKTSSSSPQWWPLETAIFEDAMEMMCRAQPVLSLFSKIGGHHLTTEESEYLEAVKSKAADLDFVTKQINESIYALPALFAKLQKAAGELAEAGCNWSWIHSACAQWSDSWFAGAEHFVTGIWTQESKVFLPHTARVDVIEACSRQRIVPKEFIKAAFGLEVRLLAGTAWLGPIAFEYITGEATSFTEKRLYDALHYWLNEGSGPLVQFLEHAEAHIAELRDRLADASTGDAARLEPLSLKVESGTSNGVGTAAQSLVENLPWGLGASDLNRETVTILREAYGLAKRVVEVYGALLNLRKQRLGEDEVDLFLLQVLGDRDSKKLLGHAIHMLRRIEGIEGATDPAKVYDWGKCPLQQIFACPSSAKSARNMAPPTKEAVEELKRDTDVQMSEVSSMDEGEVLTEHGVDDKDGSSEPAEGWPLTNHLGNI